MDMDWTTEVVGVVGAIIVITLLGTGVSYVFAPKKVDGYYLSNPQGRSGSASCVYAHWTWHPDELAFCSNDYQSALDFLAKANATVQK